MGGIAGALAAYADEVLATLAPAAQRLTRTVLQRLVTPDRTRAIVSRDELRGPAHDATTIDAIIDLLVQARLLVVQQGEEATVELVHESLIQSWPTLTRWLDEDHEHAGYLAQVRTAATQWDQRGRAPGLLWRGEAEREARQFRARYRGALGSRELAFIDAVLQLGNRSTRIRRAVLVGAVAVLAAASVVMYVFAARATTSAKEATATTIELLEEQGRRELLDQHPLHAVQSLVRAYDLGGRDPALRFLLARAMSVFEAQGPVLRGHTDMVGHVAFSADGMHVLSSSNDGTLRVWDASHGAEVTSASVLGAARVSWSRDGTRVVLAGIGEATLRDTRDLHVLARWKLGSTAPMAIALCDDGKRAIAGDDAGTVSLLDVGSEPRALQVHEGKVFAIVCGGDAWATGGDDGRVILGHDDQPRELARERGSVNALALEGGKLAAGGAAGLVDVWTTSDGEHVATYAGHTKPVRALAFAPGGALLASASEDATIRLWGPPGELPHVLTGHQGWVFSVAFDRVGSMVVTAGSDGTARVWDVASGAPIATFDAHQAEVWTAAFDRVGARIVTAGFDATARVWSIPHGASRRITNAPVGVGVNAESFDAGVTRIATGGSDGIARVYSKDGQLLTELRAGTSSIEGLAMSPDGKQIVTGLQSGTAQLWDVERRVVTANLEPARGGSYSARYRPDGRELAVAGADGVVRVFDPRTGGVLRRLTGHVKPVWGAAYSRDGAILATSSDDGTLRLWDGATGESLRTMGPVGTELNAVAFDPRAERIAAVGTDGKLRVFDVATGNLRGERVAHANPAIAVTFSEDGAFIVTASYDLAISVRDAATLRELERRPLHAKTPTWLAFLPGTTQLLSCGLDGALWLTDLALETRPPAVIHRLQAERPVE
jgi:WD40 repeat protein